MSTPPITNNDRVTIVVVRFEETDNFWHEVWLEQEHGDPRLSGRVRLDARGEDDAFAKANMLAAILGLQANRIDKIERVLA